MSKIIKKYIIVFLFVLVNIFIFTNEVEAVFTIDEAEKAIGDKEIYLEIYSDGAETVYGPKVVKVAKAGEVTYHTCSVEVPKKFTLHCFFQYMGISNAVSINPSTELLNATVRNIKSDSGGWNGVEWYVEIEIDGIRRSIF